jgi:predicted dehydrogenase
VQVAEQYLLMPAHAARCAVLRAGTIGTVGSVQISSTHLYHAVSLLRGMLGVEFEPAEVNARSFVAPLANPLRGGRWTGDDTAEPTRTILATLDFGDGRSALYDFTDNQWWNPLRERRIVIRGSRGEIVDDDLVRLIDPSTPVRSVLHRRETGRDLNLEGRDLHHISLDGAVLYRNPYVGSGLSEDDIAVAAIAEATGAWARDEGPEPYPLAQACQDHLLGLAIEESARQAMAVRTAIEPWAN